MNKPFVMKTKTSILLKRLVPLFAFVVMTACGGGDGGGDGGGGSSAQANQVSLPTFQVDASVQPSLSMMPGIDGGPERPVGSVVDQKGGQADFVLNELVVSTNDTAQLQALVTRWNGRIIKSMSFAGTRFSAIPSLHLVRVELDRADMSRLAEDIRRLDPGARGDHRFSSTEGIRLAAIGAHEAAQQGMQVTLNWLMAPMTIGNGTMIEGPGVQGSVPGATPGYTRNPADWPYMNRGSPQDIGVVAAWQALQATGRLSNRVDIMVLDGGFLRDNQDFAPDAEAYSPSPLLLSGWNDRNGHGCGGAACPWHGTDVATVALGLVDNNYGAAGAAGPVGRLHAVQSPGAWDIFGYLGYLPTVLVATAASTTNIVNMSGAAEISASLALLVDPIASVVTETLMNAGVLVVAAAGNEGANVDAEDCFIFCWEEALWFPCELSSVVCVGGMDWNSTAKAWKSNWGSKADGTSVDIYGPYGVWTWAGTTEEPPPDAAPVTDEVRYVKGTSFSSPFVAGVAALVKAANPGLNAFEVRDILFGTAHTGGLYSNPRSDGLSGNQRRINAFGAVAAALDNRIPPYVEIQYPTHLASLPWRNSYLFDASVLPNPLSGTIPTVTWYSDVDGYFGSGAQVSTAALSSGPHTITARAEADGLSTESVVMIGVVNVAPVVTRVSPSSTVTQYCANETIPFEVRVTDQNNPPEFPFQGSWVRWLHSITPDAGPESETTILGTGFSINRAFSQIGLHKVRAYATDEQNAQASSPLIQFAVVSCQDLPPVVNITNPVTDLVVGTIGSTTWEGVIYDYYDITLRADVSDPDSPFISDSSVVWSTNRGDMNPILSSYLGTGRTVNARLFSTGCGVEHTITVTVTSNGVVRNATRRINLWSLC